MIEMRDGKSTINEKEMDLDFMFLFNVFFIIGMPFPTKLRRWRKSPNLRVWTKKLPNSSKNMYIEIQW